ncbi:MAG: folate-binding protein YgfZ [Betaproteobacteria bacterium]|nr:folate-binding protein YgfZ [Betaproteobacteria bacterium]
MSNNTAFFPVDGLVAAAFLGADAAAFLQGQLTADAQQLPENEWRRAAYCSPKGRALATMLLARRGDGFAAVLPADCATDIAARLARFVMRAKVQIQILPEKISARIAPDSSPPNFFGGAVRREDGALIFDEGGGVCLRLAGADGDNGGAENGGGGGENNGAAWRREQIVRGVPWIGAAAGDIFVPQYFNWELLGGVDFGKGCYVGQEIIARLHYLGNIKRRGYILRGGGAPPAAGEKIGGADFSCQVINAAPDGGGFLALVSAPRAENGKEILWENRAARLEEPPYGLPSAAADQKPKPKV